MIPITGIGASPLSMIGILYMISTAISCGHSFVHTIMTLMPPTTVTSSIGSSKAIQRICLRTFSMRSMSSYIGMTINPVGKNLTTMFISAGEAAMMAVTTIARNQQVKAADLGLTNSSRLLIPQNLVSILMVTAIAI